MKKMNALASHILAISNEKKIDTTNLQLQKIMYFIIKDIKEKNEEFGRTIYDSPFYVWRYGPVEKSTYVKYKSYGASPILEKGKLDEDIRKVYDDEKIEKLLKQPIFQLVEKSHNNPFWKENEKYIEYGRSDKVYRYEDI